MKDSSMKNKAYQSSLIAGYDDPAIDVSFTRAWTHITRYLQVSQQPDMREYQRIPFTHEWMAAVHRFVMAGQKKGLSLTERGFYRTRTKQNITRIINGNVITFPDWTEVRDRMDILLKRMPTMSPREAFIEFERIHPFVDGNGRVGRILYYFIEWLQNNKRPVSPKDAFIFSYSNRAEVDNWFVEKD